MQVDRFYARVRVARAHHAEAEKAATGSVDDGAGISIGGNDTTINIVRLPRVGGDGSDCGNRSQEVGRVAAVQGIGNPTDLEELESVPARSMAKVSAKSAMITTIELPVLDFLPVPQAVFHVEHQPGRFPGAGMVVPVAIQLVDEIGN